MSDRTKHANRARLSRVAAAALVVYVLSLAPAQRLASHGACSANAFRTIYRPLIVLADAGTAVGSGINWYRDLLDDPPPTYKTGGEEVARERYP